MSDYLAHLVEKSFAPAPQIRPQIASLFEQPATTAAFDSPGTFDHTPEMRPGLLHAAESAESSQRPPSHAAHRNDAEPSPIRSESPRSIPIPRTSHLDLQPPSPRSVVAAPRSDTTPSPMQLIPAAVSTGETRNDALRMQQADDVPSRRPADPSILPRDPSPRTNGKTPSQPASGPGPAINTFIRPSPAVREGLSRSAPDHGRKQSRPFAPSANQPAAPSIHVTIGRVEVRVTAPAPAKSTQKKEPALSLDAYLRRRSQGGGR